MIEILYATAFAGHLALASEEEISGEAVYARCAGCHSFEYHRTGPKHCGLFGRKAGSAPGYQYSEAMRESTLVWTAEALDRFLAAPTKIVPGTTMTYAGVPDDAERRSLIAYLRRMSDSPACGKRQPGR